MVMGWAAPLIASSRTILLPSWEATNWPVGLKVAPPNGFRLRRQRSMPVLALNTDTTVSAPSTAVHSTDKPSGLNSTCTIPGTSVS